MKNVKARIANAAAQMALDGDTAQATHVLDLLATFDNIMRLPGDQGQPGFGRGWGFGDPYEEFGYGAPSPARDIPNTGDLPESFDETVDEARDEPMPGMEYEDEDDEDYFDLDGVYASILKKVTEKVGGAEAAAFASIFGTTLPREITAEAEDVEETGVEEPAPEKKPRQRRESIEVWKTDLIPDIAPIIRRILKHVSVQYSIPFTTLTDTLRDSESPIARLLADALDKLAA